MRRIQAPGDRPKSAQKALLGFSMAPTNPHGSCPGPQRPHTQAQGGQQAQAGLNREDTSSVLLLLAPSLGDLGCRSTGSGTSHTLVPLLPWISAFTPPGHGSTALAP